MIDVRTKGLPETIFVDGAPIFLNTDFRLWIDFPQILAEALNGDESRYCDLFHELVPVPTPDVVEQLLKFYHEKKEIPRTSESDGEELISYEYDGDFIFAAFVQTYGIDLTECDMHWHKYIALLNGLPDDTMLVKIMGFRGYDGTSKDNPDHRQYVELREMWRIPTAYNAAEQAEIDKFNEIF